MEVIDIIRDLAIILIIAKVFGLIAKRLGVPQVVGEIIAGLLIGPNILGLVSGSDYLNVSAEIGVILLMFMAGLTTNLKELIRSGPMALVTACVGVFVPLVGGTLLYSCFYGFAAIGTEEFFKALFMGTILTATSVSITVETLKELGKLDTRIGTVITGAAIIDDVIGIIVLTFVIGLKDSSSSSVGGVLLDTLLYIAFCATIGVAIYFIFKKIDKRAPHHRRIPIMGLALCLAMAYIADHYFGVADITGAYVAGILLCNLPDSKYINEKMDVSSYMFFGPIFFASIGIKYVFDDIDAELILFSVGFVLVGLLTKIIGCGLTAKAFKFKWNDSIKVGVGMMTRGEVALIVSQKGLEVGLLDERYFTAVIMLILVSSLLTPICLKLLFKHDEKKAALGGGSDQPKLESQTESVNG